MIKATVKFAHHAQIPGLEITFLSAPQGNRPIFHWPLGQQIGFIINLWEATPHPPGKLIKAPVALPLQPIELTPFSRDCTARGYNEGGPEELSIKVGYERLARELGEGLLQLLGLQRTSSPPPRWVFFLGDVTQ